MYKDYNAYDKDDLTKENLLNDADFINDAAEFLETRRNQNLTDPEEIYDEFMEHMRYSDTNELTTIGDWQYAQDSDTDLKQNYARLLDAYDKMPMGRLSLKMAGDYALGIATAPSTIAGIFSGGITAIGAKAGISAAKLGIRTLAKQALKRPVLAATASAMATEGAIGLGQGALQEVTRVEAGKSIEGSQKKFTGGRTVATGVGSAIGAGVINLPIQYLLNRNKVLTNTKIDKAAFKLSKKNADDFYSEGSRAIANRAREASVITKDVLSKANKTSPKKVKDIRGTLTKLDSDLVRAGREIKRDLSPTETLIMGLPQEAIDNITAAAFRTLDVLDYKKGERVTERMRRLFADADLDTPDGEKAREILSSVSNILKEHILSYKQFSLVYYAEYSDAAKTLQSASKIRRGLGVRLDTTEEALGRLNTTATKATDDLLKAIDEIDNAGYALLSAEEAVAILGNKERGKSAAQILSKLALGTVKPETFQRVGKEIFSLDKMKLGVMTMQPKTTVRNNQNAGFRVIVDALTRASGNAIDLKNPIGNGTLDLTKAMLTPYETMALKKLFKKQFPQEAAKIFREGIDIESGTTNTIFAKIGRKVNILNTYSDNFWKSSVIATSLTRQLNDWKAPLSSAARRQILINRIGLHMGDADNVRATQYLDNLTERQYADLLKANDLQDPKLELKLLGYDKDFSLLDTVVPNPRDLAKAGVYTQKDGTIKIPNEAINKYNKYSQLKGEYDELLKKHDLEETYYNLKNTIYSGQFDLIPEKMLHQAMADAYDFVYQTPLSSETWMGKFAKGFIKAHGDYPFVLSTFMPFPRFVASQLKFINDHMPIMPFITRPLTKLGMKDKQKAKWLKKHGWFDTDWKPTAEGKKLFSKQMAGGMTLLAAYAWRAKQGDTNYWYEIKDSEGNNIDARAFYGPFSPFMLVADTIYRIQTGTSPQNFWRRLFYDSGQALLGSTFRTGVGLYAIDKMWDDLSTGDFERAVGNFLGDIVAAFNVPWYIVSDLYGTFDKEARKIPETRFGTDTRRVIGDEPFFEDLDDRLINIFDAMYWRGTRSMPDFPLRSWGESIGIPVDYLPERDYGRPARSPFQSGDLTKKEMIEGQVTGFNARKPKNAMQIEMGRLNLYAVDVYQRDSDELIDMYTRWYLSEIGLETNLNEHIENYVLRSEEYKNAGVEGKRMIFLRESKKIINEAKEFAKAQIDYEQQEMNKKLPEPERLNYSQTHIAAWNKVPKNIKKRIQEEYEETFGGEGTILADRNRKTFVANGYRTSPLLWGLDRFTDLRGKSGDL